MIPEAAVEAIVELLAARDYPAYMPDPEWARAILEAAAPHMLAEAWDQAIEAAAMRSHDINCAEIAGESPPGGLINNPYRVTK